LAGADPEAVYNLCLILKLYYEDHVKISEPTSGKLQGKLKLTEEEKRVCIFVSVYYVFHYSSVLVISRFQLLISAEA
jgi:hypothetical protein